MQATINSPIKTASHLSIELSELLTIFLDFLAGLGAIEGIKTKPVKSAPKNMKSNCSLLMAIT